MQLSKLEKMKLPDAPGIYLFKDSKGNILYVGKATSLKDRVRSYFRDDILKTRGLKIGNMVTLADRVDFIQTDSVLEALILEANFIKKYTPKYNTREKDDKSYNMVVITNEEFPRVLVARQLTLTKEFPGKSLLYAFGPFTQGSSLREAMKIVRKIFPYRDRCEPKSGKACFNRQIGLCPGVCTGEMDAKEYKKQIRRIQLFFDGKQSDLIKKIEKDMKTAAKNEAFEEANGLKKMLFSLKHINDITLMKRDVLSRELIEDKESHSLFSRIESYDVAHLQGSARVGVMTVATGGIIDKSQYRKFKLEEKVIDDILALSQILERRFTHEEWPLPNLIVVDGALPQKHCAEKIIANHKLDIEVVAVVKNSQHKPERLIGLKKTVDKYQDIILKLNAEAHRFAISYHKNVRKKKLIPR